MIKVIDIEPLVQLLAVMVRLELLDDDIIERIGEHLEDYGPADEAMWYLSLLMHT